MPACGVFDNEQEDIIASIEGEEIILYNNTSEAKYVMALPVQMLALIQYCYCGPKIEPKETLYFNLRETVGGGYEAGDEIDILYWESEKPESEEIKRIRIK